MTEVGGIEALQADIERLQREVEQLQATVARKDEWTRKLLEYAVEGFHIVGLDGRLRDCNAAFADNVGYTREQILTMHITDIDTRPELDVGQAIAAIMQGGAHRFRAKHRHSSGALLDVDVTARLVRMDDADEPFILAFARVDTDKIERERALTASEQRFRGIFDATSMFIALLAPDGRVLRLNRTLLDFVPDAPDLEARPELWTCDFWDHDPAARQAIEHCVRSAAAGADDCCEVGIHGHNGRSAILDLRVKSIAGDDGRPALLVAEGYDVSELRHANAERAALHEQIIHSQEEVIRELLTPLVPLDAGVVAMPLVGKLDQVRASHLIDRLLAGVAEHRASVAILDVTGVREMDHQTASTLVRAAQAVRLLGAEAILTGIRPEVAHALLALGADLGHLTTMGSLQSGLAHAREQVARGRR